MERRYAILLLFSVLSGTSSAQDLAPLCLPQHEGRFWSVDGGIIQEWTVSGDVITGGAVVATGPADINSLAFCSAAGPTGFYGDHVSGVQYYDGNSWTPVPMIPDLYNCGGAGAHLYFMDISNDLYHFTGTAATLIASAEEGYSFSCDVVADQAGNAYVVFGPSSTDVPASGFRKYSPEGTLLQSWSASFNDTNGWGAFMLGNTIYIAFGPFNPEFPDQLVPFTLDGGSVNQGTPIPFGKGDMKDLASCMEALPLSVDDPITLTGTLSIQPNPATGQASILLGRAWRATTEHIELLDANGRARVPRLHAVDTGVTFQVDDLPPGVYHVRLSDTGGNRRSGRLVVAP